MPLKLNVGASKKVGESNYGSRGASVNIELETDLALVNDPPKLHGQIRQLFKLVRASLVEELNGNGNGDHPDANTTPAEQRKAGNTPPCSNTPPRNNPPPCSNPPRAATPSQVKAIYAIAKAQQVDVKQLLLERFHVGRADELSLKEASQLIDSLKSAPQVGG